MYKELKIFLNEDEIKRIFARHFKVYDNEIKFYYNECYDESRSTVTAEINSNGECDIF